MAEFVVFGVSFTVLAVLWRGFRQTWRGALIPTLFICWLATLIWGLRDLPAGLNWNSILFTPVGLLFVGPLLGFLLSYSSAAGRSLRKTGPGKQNGESTEHDT